MSDGLFLNFGLTIYRLAVYLLHVGDELEHLVRVTDLIVIPRHNLYESIGEVNTCVSVEDRSHGATQEVRRNNCVLGVTQNTLQLTLGSLLHGSADSLLGSGLSQVNGQVNYRNVQGRNTHRDTSQLAVQLGNNLTYCLCGTSRGRNDVARCCAATTPILHGRTINGLLGSGGRVNGGHQTVNDTELVVQHLSDRSQAVGGARSVRNELSTLLVLVEVHAAYEHRSVVLGRSGHHYIFSASLDMSLSLLLGQEQTGRLHYILSLNLVPLQISGVTLCGDTNLLTVNDQLAVLNISLDSAIESTVHSVILQHVSQVIYGAKVIDTYYLDVVASLSCAENETTDTAKSVNTNLNHLLYSFKGK